MKRDLRTFRVNAYPPLVSYESTLPLYESRLTVLIGEHEGQLPLYSAGNFANPLTKIQLCHVGRSP